MVYWLTFKELKGMLLLIPEFSSYSFRWGRTPLDEATLNDHTPLIPILTEAAKKGKQSRSTGSTGALKGQ